MKNGSWWVVQRVGDAFGRDALLDASVGYLPYATAEMLWWKCRNKGQAMYIAERNSARSIRGVTYVARKLCSMSK